MPAEKPIAEPDGRTDGLLLVDKPAGITSHDAVAIVRRAVGTRRVGHTGTLDPFATGLLVVLVGRGTRLIPYVDGEPKVYEATIRFGAETDTDDLTGAVTHEPAVTTFPPDEAVLEGVARLTGRIEQIPPAYSAKQVGGRRAYDAARRGESLELAPVTVTVFEWTLLGREGNDLRARITCSGGTYIRALARDLGRYADSAAHLSALRRVCAGPFDVSDAVTIDALEAGEFRMRPLLDAVPSLPVATLDAAQLVRVSHGNPIDVPEGNPTAGPDGQRIALVDDRAALVAIAERVGTVLQPRLVMRDA